MLAQHRRMAADRRPVVIEQHRIAHRLDAAEPRMIDLAHDVDLEVAE